VNRPQNINAHRHRPSSIKQRSTTVTTIIFFVDGKDKHPSAQLKLNPKQWVYAYGPATHHKHPTSAARASFLLPANMRRHQRLEFGA
jgi:hypothetical protein